MGWFKTKEEKQVIADKAKKDREESKKIKDQRKYPYRVYLKDIGGSATKKHAPFGVERFIDVDNSTVYLRNTGNGFKEIMPEDTDDYKIYAIEDVKTKIGKLVKALAKEIDHDDPEVNKRNIEHDLRLFRNRLRSLELQGRGSYQNYDDDGTPYFVFRRKGNFKFPEFDNVELDTLYTPSETKIKKASELLDMKNEKYSKFQSNLTSITMTFFVLLVICAGMLVWWSLKLGAVSNDSAVVQLQERIDETALYCADMYGQAGENFYDSSIYVKNITETLVKDLHKPSVVIDGITPN